jgi:phosphopantothenoylcysteine decarboxylase/phosphopantothenate--cysteine ligase
MAQTARLPQRVLVTAGPTREHLDEVRFLSNPSTGRMGWEIAREARRGGAQVTLVLGPCDLPDPPGVETVRVTSAREMLAAAQAAARAAQVVVFAAAPADWRPARRARGKIPKGSAAAPRVLRLVENPDIAATLGRSKGRRVHIGFALEVAHGFERALAKMARKRFDAVVLNGPANVGRGGGDAWWIARGADPVALPTGDKRATARAVWRAALGLFRRAVGAR